MESKSITRNEEFMKSVEDIMTGNITPITREEILWAKVLGENVPDIVPVIRKEIFLAKIAGADIQTPKPITREEMYLDAIANGTELKLKPITRKEMFYAKVLGLTDSAPEPVTRLEQILDQVEPSGGGTGGGGEENYDKYSWEGVRAAIKNGTYKDVYKVGDLVPIDLGSEGKINMQIIAFDTDDLADGSGKAPITWLSKGCLATKKRMNPELVGTYPQLQEGTGGIGGWEKCEMRSYLRDTIKPLLPDVVRTAIKNVYKKQKARTTENGSFQQTTTDDVWVPDINEVYGTSALYFDWFQDSAGKRVMRDQSGAITDWWTREAYGSGVFTYITYNGYKSTGQCTVIYGVVVGFCT